MILVCGGAQSTCRNCPGAGVGAGSNRSEPAVVGGGAARSANPSPAAGPAPASAALRPSVLSQVAQVTMVDPEQLMRLVLLGGQQALQAAEMGGQRVNLSSPQAAERVLEEAVGGLCRSRTISGNDGLYHYVLRVTQKCLIENGLRRAGGNQLKAAALLGLNRNTLRAKMKELGIRSEDFEEA